MPYLIDGHNLIPKIPGMSLKEMDDEARLVEWLQLFSRIERQKVEVFFDGAPAGSTGVRMHGTVKAHYVPLASKADYAIANRLHSMGRSARNWKVVTSDRQVQAEARSCGAVVVPSETFAADLLAAQRKAQEKAREDGEIIVGDVDEWLDLFSRRGK